ncbi:N-acetyl-D-glucosamine kinase-like isoform X2 [Carya illinoinensis]|uniref:N-acetyl-D-glucosamine kinase-like isoform X2 n=1 Tax=Carya illinoinensis TaxID=32201 RepID=UPI001C72439F|nr:N-acetyl-D-glucosamine kinase-like isoform X2 [Carya illinoinensis]
MKRHRNGEIWDFEHELPAVAANQCGVDVVLGLDGGTTSTVCVCMPVIPCSRSHFPDPLPVLARAVAGCSNHNSVGDLFKTGKLRRLLIFSSCCISVVIRRHERDHILWKSQRPISFLLDDEWSAKFFFSLEEYLEETAARETLEQVMADALAKSGLNRTAVRAVCLAVSGVNHPMDQQRIIDWLSDIFPSHVQLYVQNDAVAALASGTMGKLHGCVLIAGTGTIAYGFTEDGREARAAGAGPILGDWGSGYGIAAQALTAIIRAHDGRGPHTMLTSSILQMLDLVSPDELIGWTYADPSWARIAALVPVVVSCAEAGDEVANTILLDSVQELASSVKAVVQRLGLCGEGGACSWGSAASLEFLHERIQEKFIEAKGQ